MRSWLIDSDGDALPEGSAAIETYLGPHGSLDEAEQFLLSNAGYIRVVTTGSHAKVAFERDGVHPYAVVGLLRLLTMQLQPAAVAVQETMHSSQTNIIREKRVWLDYFGSLAHSLKGTDSRVSRQIALPASPFAARYGAARIVVSKVQDPETQFELLDELSERRFVLMRQEPETGMLTVVRMGSWYEKGLNTTFASSPSGRPLSDAQSGGYGNWVQQHYQTVMRLGKPVADDVDATVSWEGNKPVIYRYTRLVLPIDRGPSDRWLLAMTKMRAV